MAARGFGGRGFRGRALRPTTPYLESPPDESFIVRVAWVQLEIPAAPSSGGATLKVWNGSAWVAKPLKVWNGSSWVTATLKRWNGGAWV